MNIDQDVMEIRSLLSNSEYELALNKCDELIKLFPDAWNVYRMKADIYNDQKNYKEEWEVRQHLIAVNSEEPSDYYDLTRLALRLGYYREAVSMANMGISLCEKHNNLYYFQACYFYKANALLSLKKYDEVADACSHLDDGYGTYISNQGMVAKEDLIKKALDQSDQK